MLETNKRAAGYVRVSTDGQAEGTSLDTQEERILERAKKEGRTVWKEDVYVDVESATVYERAALQEAFWGRAGLGGTTRCMFLGRTGWPVPGWIS